MPGFHRLTVLPGHSPDHATVGEYHPVRKEGMPQFSGLPKTLCRDCQTSPAQVKPPPPERDEKFGAPGTLNQL